MNSKTTWTGISSAIVATLTMLAALPYSLGEIATVFPPEWKPYIVVAGLVATLILRSLNAIQTQDATKTIEPTPPSPGQAAIDEVARTSEKLRPWSDGQAAQGQEGDRQ